MHLPLDPATVVHVGIDGKWHPPTIELARGLALLPGSFNPLHIGHRELARIAASILSRDVAFEISIANVDKPPLDAAVVNERLAQFHGQADVWLTHAPRFAEKAVRFPASTFVVGADTALRIVSTRYYGNDDRRMIEALEAIESRSCRFLVACRVDSAGRLLRLEDVPIPVAFRALFAEIPPKQFRWDISSTELRGT